MESELHKENWWTRNLKILQFIITTSIAVAAVWIAIVQNQINAQLRDLEYFKFLQPSIGESISSSTWCSGPLSLDSYSTSFLVVF